jgi:hypothetical protein
MNFLFEIVYIYILNFFIFLYDLVRRHVLNQSFSARQNLKLFSWNFPIQDCLHASQNIDYKRQTDKIVQVLTSCGGTAPNARGERFYVFERWRPHYIGYSEIKLNHCVVIGSSGFRPHYFVLIFTTSKFFFKESLNFFLWTVNLSQPTLKIDF